MNFKFSQDELKNTGSGGLEIKIEGLTGDPTDQSPGTSVFIENYEGKILCHVWTDGKQDCQSITLT
jgi:hypothetical protein